MEFNQLRDLLRLYFRVAREANQLRAFVLQRGLWKEYRKQYPALMEDYVMLDSTNATIS
jgi:hypothetical protein